MRGVRFYEEFDNKRNKRKGISQGNVVAVFPENKRLEHYADGTADLVLDCIAAVYSYPDSPVCGCGVSWGYLRESCKRISETEARQVHPQLFWVLDQTD